MSHRDGVGGNGVFASVVIALDEENSYFKEAISDRCEVVTDSPGLKSRIWRLKSKPNRRVAVATIGRMGNERSAAMTAAMWHYHTSPYVILIGIAGIIQVDKYRLGDVIVATDAKTRFPNKVKALAAGKEIVIDRAKTPVKSTTARYIDENVTEVDSRDKFFGNGYLRHIRDKAASGRARQLVSEYMKDLPMRLSKIRIADSNVPSALVGPNRPPQIFNSPVFSWGMVVDNEEYRKFLIEKNDDYCLDYYNGEADGLPIACVDMESFGFFSFFEELNRFGVAPPAVFTVRGLSDHTGNKKTAGDNWRRLALVNAAHAAIDLIDWLPEK